MFIFFSFLYQLKIYVTFLQLARDRDGKGLIIFQNLTSEIKQNFCVFK